MRLTDEGRFERSDIWREGKWLDLWSVVHLLSGISFGLGASLFNFGTTPTMVIMLLLFIAYEMWEALVGIEETAQNHCTDVVVGMASFVPTFLYLTPALQETRFTLAFGFVLTVNITMATFGWLASRKAATLEAALRTDIERQRQKFLLRRERFQAKREEQRRLRRLERKRS